MAFLSYILFIQNKLVYFFFSLLSSHGLSNQFIDPSVRFHTFNRGLQNAEQTLKRMRVRLLEIIYLKVLNSDDGIGAEKFSFAF